MPVHLSLQAAHDELGTTIEMTIDEVKSVYKKQALLHHPDRNQNSQESTEKFQRLSNAYDRIINPPKEPSFASPFGGGGMGGMGGFPRGGFAFTTPGGTFFFGGGGGRGGGFGDGFGGGGFGGGGGYYDGSDEEENYEDDYDEQEYDDEYEDEEDEDDDYDDYARFAYEDILGGGFGTRASYRTYKAHHQQRETPEERAERIRVEAENIRKNEERRKNEAKWEKERREKEREEESRSAASRRALKKASQNAAKAASSSAASSSAASLAAFKRLQLAQLKRSAVFAALRTGDVEAAKKGVYDENVDPGTAGEWLEGGREAVEGLGEEEREALEREIQGVKAGGKGVAKKRQNAPAAAAAGGGGKGKGKKAAQTPVSPSPAPVESATSSAIVSAGAAKGGKGKKKGKGGKGDKKDDDEEAFWAELAKNVPAKIPTPPASVIETVPEKKSAAYDLDNENDDDDLPDLVDANGWADPVINQKMITAPPPKVEIPFEEMTKSQQKRFKKKQADEKKKAAPAEGGAATSAAKETEGAKEEEEAKEEKEPAAAAESTPAAGGSSSKKGKGKKKKAGPSSAAPAEAPKTVTPPSPSTPTASVPTSPEILQKKKKGGASAPSTAPTSPEVSKDAGAEQELSQDERETEKGEGDVVEYDPKETMLHLAVKRGDAGMVEWLISHGADPTARDSSSLSFFHLALLLSHLSILTSFLESSPPPFPAPDGAEELSSYSSDAFYPLPRGHSSLLSLALAGGVGKGGKHSLERVKAVRETVKASLPFSGGREIRQGWKKVEGEVKRVPSKKENVRNEWEEVKWAMAERAKQLNFDEFSPPEEYLRRRRPVV